MFDELNPTTYVSRKLAAGYIAHKTGRPCALQTMARWACQGQGPKYTIVGRFPRYLVADLDEWLSSITVSPLARTRPNLPDRVTRIELARALFNFSAQHPDCVCRPVADALLALLLKEGVRIHE